MKTQSTKRRSGWLPALLALLTTTTLSGAAAGGTAATPGGERKDEALVLSVFEVTGDRDVGYRSTQTVASTRTLENLRDTPNSISIINRELIDDLGATSMAQLSTFGITGEVEDNVETNRIAYAFRGSQGTQLRNGVFWLLPKDTFNLERVEIFRGPAAFLYGEGNPGGAVNQVTKQAVQKDFEKLILSAGSNDARRAEVDLNRRITDKAAVRLSLVYDDMDGVMHHTHRTFKGFYTAFNYRPFQGTNISANFELGRNFDIRGSNIPADRFSTTQRTGATTAYSVTTGGWTLLPATGQIINTATSRFSGGTGIALTDVAILPREYNFMGPDSSFRQHYDALQVAIEQRVGRNFNVQLDVVLSNTNRYIYTRAGSLSAGIYLDANRNRPDGTPNPYFNQYYTESYDRKLYQMEPKKNWRLTAVYDLKLGFTTQRIMAMGSYHVSNGNQNYHSEYVDPSSPAFTGTLRNENTLAAYQANLAVMQRNFFYRRFYLVDGDGASITRRGVVPGRSIIARDISADGAGGHQTDRRWLSPGWGVGASGSYLKGRLRSLVGWRRDAFIQDPTFDYYNVVSGETYRLASTPPVRNRFYKSSMNGGVVAHVTKFASAYFNYAQSVNTSNGPGGTGIIPGTTRGLLLGDGRDFGVRWSFLDGRLESNWTYYVTNAFNNNSNPAVPTNVKNELTAYFSELVPAGIDTQTSVASGIEFETVANLTPSWRLTWNFSTNDLETSERYPQLRSYQARAKEKNLGIPLTEQFLDSAPDGTPLPGFTKIRSNLVSNYNFNEGALKGLSLGGSVQYRDQAYRGNFDLDRDGFAERLWTPGYTVWNFMAGYRTTVWRRKVDFRFNLNNALDKSYFRSSSLASGSWSDRRNFRITTRIDF
jgi:outer membrane receptor protein involved in Fe transport